MTDKIIQIIEADYAEATEFKAALTTFVQAHTAELCNAIDGFVDGRAARLVALGSEPDDDMITVEQMLNRRKAAAQDPDEPTVKRTMQNYFATGEPS